LGLLLVLLLGPLPSCVISSPSIQSLVLLFLPLLEFLPFLILSLA